MASYLGEQGEVAVRLPTDDLEEFLVEHDTERSLSYRAVMQDLALIPWDTAADPGRLAALLRRAHAHVDSLARSRADRRGRADLRREEPRRRAVPTPQSRVISTAREDAVARTVLLLGRTPIVLDGIRAGIDTDDVRLLAGTGLDDVRRAFADEHVDVVIMGAGIDLDTRLEIVRHVFESSTGTTVHMKDRDSGPAGMLPFVRGILRGAGG